MGKITDEHDQPTSERGRREYKIGFKGFDWWRAHTSVGVPFFFDWGGWHGPLGYANGAWRGWGLTAYFLVWGCRIEWVSEWIPTDENDPEPRLRTERGPQRRRIGI